MNSTLLFVALLLGTALGHSYLTNPTSRTNQRQSQTGCRGPACLGPCDGTTPRAPVTIARGQSLSLQWPRNNHAAGFIRFAWAPTAQSNTHSAFDGNVQLYTCHEVGRTAGGACAPGLANNPTGGDSNPGDGSTGACAISLTVPPHLTDGLWTLQWAWFGGAFALGDYYSCVDYQISGGATGNKPAVAFQGGDYTNPSSTDRCLTFNTDALHVCVNEPCDAPKFTSARSVPCLGCTGGSGTPTSAAVATSATTVTCSGMCPNPNAPNLNGDTLNPPRCGSNAPTARCADGQCCSQYGFCGPIKDTDGNYKDDSGNVITYDQAVTMYCTNNQGDWRLIPCSQTPACATAGSPTSAPTSNQVQSSARTSAPTSAPTSAAQQSAQTSRATSQPTVAPTGPVVSCGNAKPGESFPAEDGCNQCFCGGNGIATCTDVACASSGISLTVGIATLFTLWFAL